MRDDDGIERRLLASVSRTEGRRHLLDGQRADPATIARSRPPVAVFAPDRLSLVKGPPAERRAHLDGFLAARWPARGELRKRFGQALAQRNAMLARVAAGYGSPAALDVWDAGVAEAAAPLIAARAEAVAELAPAFAAALAELGLRRRRARSTRRAPRATRRRSARACASAATPTCKLGRSSWGPHLDELKLNAGGRALRRYGSQGQQRAALLALLFAEREALLEARRVTPLLLLDDVMSELDPGRRERLVARLAAGGQTLITAADEESLPPAARATMVRMPSPASSRTTAAIPARRPRDPPARAPGGRRGVSRRARTGGAEDRARRGPGGLGGGRR